MLEISNENFSRIARVYCNYCLYDHWLDIIELYNDDDDKFIFEFNAKDIPNFTTRLKESFNRISSKKEIIQSPVEIVAISVDQLKRIMSVIENSEIELTNIHKFPIINWEKRAGLGGMKFGNITVSLQEVSLRIDVIQESHTDKITIENIELGWYTEDNLNNKNPKVGFIKILKRRINYLFFEKDYLYHREIALSRKSSEILFSLLKLLSDNLEEIKRRDGSSIYKVDKKSIMLEIS